MKKLAALSVHLFTSCGIVAGFYAIEHIALGQFNTAMWWMFLAFFIDGIDGTFARLFKVKEVLPQINGTTIDYVIDFCTYAVIPAFMMYRYPGLVPAEVNDITAIMVLLVSAMYYGLSGMVSQDMHFVGFPVMWNFVAFLLIFALKAHTWGDGGAWINFGILIFFSILHFVPIKFAYPSRATFLFIPHLIASIVFVGICPIILYFEAQNYLALNLICLSAVIYFGATAVYTTYFRKED